MTIKSVSAACLFLGALSACVPSNEETAAAPAQQQEAKVEQAADQQPTIIPAQISEETADLEQTSTIDWAAARQDLASGGGTEDSIFAAASADDEPPSVPILLPTNAPVTTASTGGPRIKQTADGYYAVYKYEKFDVIVNGTNEVIGQRSDAPRDEAMKFTATAAGGQVSLSRYGADYLVEFECYQINPETGTCIEEAEALDVANSLVVRRTR